MRRGLSLRGKMLLFTFGIVAVLTGLSSTVIHRFVVKQVQIGVGEDLEKTQSVFEKFMRERVHWLRSQCWVVAEDPRFTATLDIHDPDLEYQSKTVLREAKRFQSIIGSGLFIVTNRTGQVLAQIEVSNSSGEDLSQMPTVVRALEGQHAVEMWTLEGNAYPVATVTIRRKGKAIGTLSASIPEEGDSDALIRELNTVTEGERIHQSLEFGGLDQKMEIIREIQTSVGNNLVAITDRTGRSGSLVLRRTSYGEDLWPSPRVQGALQGYDSMGLQVYQGRLVQMVVVPVWSQGEVIGTLSTGFEIDDRLARDLREMMHSEVSFSLNGRVVASTWPEGVQGDLETSLFGIEEDQGRAGPFEMAVGAETYLSLLEEIDVGGRGEKGFYLIQHSLDQAIGFLTTIERLLILIGGGVLGAAALISFVGVAQIVKPIKALVEGTRRLAAGDLSQRIDVESQDEIGELAGSFNVMSGELTKSRSALTESERRYRDLFDNAHDFVYTTDLEMRLTSVNKDGLELLGRSYDDVIGKSFCDFLSSAGADRLKVWDRRQSPGTTRPGFEVEMVCKNGNTATLEVVSRWIMEEGRAVGTHGIGRDITERRERDRATNRFREQLHQAEKLRALGEMAAGVAHNFNNLLAGVLGYAQLIELKGGIPKSALDNVRKIVTLAKRCSAVIRRIQAFGRPIDTTTTELVDLHEVIQETVEITQPKWKTGPEREGRAIKVSVDLGDDPPIESTVAVWEEILSNLIFNAVDAMPRGGRITITTRREGDKVVLSVSDTGLGMDEETKRRIFEPFFTTKKPELGTGLGLSTVWGLLQSQEGQIEIDSTPGQGTTFTIRTPVAPESKGSTEIQEEIRSTSGLKILVIDDDPFLRDILSQLLQGHHVDSAEGGREGIALVGEGNYDLVISDWAMGEVSGLDVAEKVKQLSPGTVTVLMSGWEVKNSTADRHPNVDLTMQKPFMEEDVNRIVGEAAKILKKED